MNGTWNTKHGPRTSFWNRPVNTPNLETGCGHLFGEANFQTLPDQSKLFQANPFLWGLPNALGCGPPHGEYIAMQ